MNPKFFYARVFDKETNSYCRLFDNQNNSVKYTCDLSQFINNNRYEIECCVGCKSYDKKPICVGDVLIIYDYNEQMGEGAVIWDERAGVFRINDDFDYNLYELAEEGYTLVIMGNIHKK